MWFVKFCQTRDQYIWRHSCSCGFNSISQLIETGRKRMENTHNLGKGKTNLWIKYGGRGDLSRIRKYLIKIFLNFCAKMKWRANCGLKKTTRNCSVAALGSRERPNVVQKNPPEQNKYFRPSWTILIIILEAWSRSSFQICSNWTTHLCCLSTHKTSFFFKHFFVLREST